MDPVGPAPSHPEGKHAAKGGEAAASASTSTSASTSASAATSVSAGTAAAPASLSLADALVHATVLCDEEGAIDVLGEMRRTGAAFPCHVVDGPSAYTVLHYACDFRMDALVPVLLDAGWQHTATSDDLVIGRIIVQAGGMTPLHFAARAGCDVVVSALLDAGADPTVADWDGKTPAALARSKRHVALAGRLAELSGEDTGAGGNAGMSGNTAGGTAGGTAAGGAMEATANEATAMEATAMVSARRSERASRMFRIPPGLREAYVVPRVWSVDECERIYQAAHAAALGRGGWMTGRHSNHATTDLPCAALDDDLDTWVRDSLHANVVRVVAKKHGLAADRMRFADLFFVRYSAVGGAQRGLALHMDASVASFNILLNEPMAFDGGGTFFEAEDKTYHIGRGECLVHAGNVKHGAKDITRGERLVLVGFLKGGFEP